jgi:putative hemolysin
MKYLQYIALLSILSLSACAAVYTDASDANQVTFLNSDGESMASLTQKANAYCAQYGKTASFRKADTQLVAVFNCNWPQSSPR